MAAGGARRGEARRGGGGGRRVRERGVAVSARGQRCVSARGGGGRGARSLRAPPAHAPVMLPRASPHTPRPSA